MQVLSKYRYQKNKFWVGVLKDAANATTFADFDLNLNNILTSLKESSKFIDESEPRRWANAVFVGDRWGIMNNNLAESWNSWIKEARTMPPLAMVDSIRVKVMKMMSERRDEGAWMNGVLCPEPDKRVQRNCLEARDVTVVVASGVLFEVFELEKRFVVDVEKRTCTCGKWQIEKLPCKHGCACIETLHQNVYDYCDPHFRVDAYRQTYSGVLYPIPNDGTYPTRGTESDFVHPPDVRRLPGRPKTKRFASQVESSNVRCGLCKKYGHNRRTCREPRVCSQ